MSKSRCDVLVVGAGLAGLTAADQLTRAGVDVQVVEAAPRAGGRIRGVQDDGTVLDTGAEFIGREHQRLRTLLASLGLRTEPTRLDRSPILWRLGGQQRVSHLPPLPAGELARLGLALWRLRRHALTLDAEHPWTSPAAAELDAVSLADWLTLHRVAEPGLQVVDAIIGGFATRPITDVSAAHAGWWISAAGGLLAALRSGQHSIVIGGAHQIPQRLAARLAPRIHLDSPVTVIAENDRGVEVHTAQQTWAADAVIVAVPVPALRNLVVDPPLAAPLHTALAHLAYGRAVKIAATATVTPSVRHHVVAGGQQLVIAWRYGDTLSGIASSDSTTDELVEDLAAAFELTAGQLGPVAVTDWNREPYVGGSYLIYRPNQLTNHAGALRANYRPRIRFAGADFSTWPNSMEGAVQSGRTTAADLLAR